MCRIEEELISQTLWIKQRKTYRDFDAAHGAGRDQLHIIYLKLYC